MIRARSGLLLLLAACATAPSDPDLLFRECAQHYAATGNAEESIARLGRILDRHPGHVDARMMRGGLHEQAGRRREAESDYDAVLKRDPRHADALMARALAQDLQDCDTAALADATAFIGLRPEIESGYLLRGWIHREAGRTTESFQDFEKARELGAARWASWFNAGVTALAARRIEEAERLLGWAAELDASRPEIPMALGRAHLQLARYEDAVRDFTRAAERGTGADAFHHRGNALLALKRHREAKEDYDRAIEQRPEEGAYYYGRAIARIGLGDLDQAERDLTSCLDRVPDHWEALHQRSLIRSGKERFDEAERDLIQALKLSATAELAAGLARIYAAKKDWGRAASAFQGAINLCEDDALRRTLETELAAARREQRPR